MAETSIWGRNVVVTTFFTAGMLGGMKDSLVRKSAEVEWEKEAAAGYDNETMNVILLFE